jgi:hypothetical protein
MVLSMADACDLLSLLISNSYSTCFGKVYQHLGGIQMGVPPGVFLANL